MGKMRDGRYREANITSIRQVRREGSLGRDMYERMECVCKENNSGIDTTDV